MAEAKTNGDDTAASREYELAKQLLGDHNSAVYYNPEDGSTLSISHNGNKLVYEHMGTKTIEDGKVASDTDDSNPIDPSKLVAVKLDGKLTPEGEKFEEEHPGRFSSFGGAGQPEEAAATAPEQNLMQGIETLLSVISGDFSGLGDEASELAAKFKSGNWVELVQEFATKVFEGLDFEGGAKVFERFGITGHGEQAVAEHTTPKQKDDVHVAYKKESGPSAGKPETNKDAGPGEKTVALKGKDGSTTDLSGGFKAEAGGTGKVAFTREETPMDALATNNAALEQQQLAMNEPEPVPADDYKVAGMGNAA